MKSTTSLFLIAATATLASAAKSAPSAPGTATTNKKPLQFNSPLQSFTIFDKSTAAQYASPRSKFLPRFRVGLLAERRAREVIAEEMRRGIGYDDDDEDIISGSWAEQSAQAEERRKKAMEKRVEQAYDAAVKSYDDRVAAKQSAVATSGSDSNNKYQFVGVVNNNGSGKSKDNVTWYARKKPKSSNWNVRLLHVNRDAVLRDLFVKGKVDVYGKYINEGIDKAAFAVADNGGAAVEEGDKEGTSGLGMRPLVKGQYSIKERSWRTLWNFSPTRFFSTSSGSFWRERRIPSGLYTDGTNVYESVYRYRDGKNGLKPVAKLSSFLSSPSLGVEDKMRVVERLKGGDEPDVVVEK
eukprot:g327.t1 g327   contig1:790543-791601(-)